jgi:hypothetical protein
LPVLHCHWTVNLAARDQTQDFKIRYTSISRLYILPKSATPHTLVVIGLDPAIRKGQTYYSYLLCQFNNADEINMELEISDEVLAQKNEKVICLYAAAAAGGGGAAAAAAAAA